LNGYDLIQIKLELNARDEARVEPRRSAHWVKVKNLAAKVLASENSPQGQHDENANADVIGK
jgi:hypothetical protein